MFPFELSIERFIGFSTDIDLFNLMGLGKVKSYIPFIKSKNNMNQDVNTIVGEGNNSIVLNSQLGDIFLLSK